MTLSAHEAEAYVDAAAALLALPIAAEHRPGVLHWFALAAGFAELVQAQPLGPHDEPAPAFVPIGPDDPAIASSASAPKGEPAGDA